MTRVALVSFRLGGPDGVSVGAGHWAEAFRRLGLRVRTVAGAGLADRLVPGLEMDGVAGPDLPGRLAEALAGVLRRVAGVVFGQCTNCRNPVPGDPIVGYITRGRGVTVHRTDCTNVKASSEKERHVDVEWERTAARTYPVAIRIEGWDRDGFLRDVAAVISENQVALVALSALANPDKTATVNATLQVTSVEQLSRVLAKLEGVRDVLVRGDVSNEDDVVRMVGEAVDGLGGIDVLVNNAGIQISRPTEELSSDDFDRVLAVNLRGAFLCAREAIRHCLAADKPGSIVNISSVHQLIPKPGYLGYSASKGGMQNLTRTLALEYAGRGIRVNGVGPGATVTPINRAWIDDPEKRRQVEEHIPMQRAGDADEMAGVTAFLASDEAAYVTGQTIFVDGGLTLFPSFLTPWSSE